MFSSFLLQDCSHDAHNQQICLYLSTVTLLFKMTSIKYRILAENNTRLWQKIWPTGNQQHFYLRNSTLLPSAWYVT